MAWMRERGARVAAVGATAPNDADQVVRYLGDDDADVSLLAEALVAELAAAARWRRG
jgi:hypothetical protein